MKAHVIENGKVINTIVVNSLDVFPNIVEATEGGIGWSYVDGKFIKPVRDLDQEWSIVRKKRNQLLGETDWTQNADVTQAIKDKWSPYRQLLRDIPQTFADPNDVVWPTQPE